MSRRSHRTPRSSRIGRRALVPTLVATLALVSTASAHDFWIIPDVFNFASDSTIHVSGRAGTRFPAGSPVQPARVADARMIGAATQTRITQMSVEGNSLRLHEKAPAAGQYVFAVTLNSTPTRSTVAGLLRFLRAEGGASEAARLESTSALAGQDSLVFQATSYATTVVEVGRGGPRAFSMATGLPLSFVPVNDPSALHVGDTLHVKVVGGDKTVPGIGVYGGPAMDMAVATGGAAQMSLPWTTDANGVLHLPLTKAGAWNLRAAWVYRQSGAAANDWKIARSTFVFGVREQASQTASGQTPEAEVRASVASYNAAMLSKDLPALKALLAPDIVLYEHSVRNVGLDDVWENHLRPEVAGFDNMRAEFTDVRVTATPGMALVMRQYRIQATMRGKPIDAKGNETMVWVRRDGAWRVAHIHYSHPCPRPASP